MEFHVADVRSAFTAFTENPDLIYLDSAATTQIVTPALEAVSETEKQMRANVHRGMYPLVERITNNYESARKTVAHLINAQHSQEIIFTKNTSESINIVAKGLGLTHEDTIVISLLEHHSNIVPWQMESAKSGAKIEWIPLNQEGEIDIDAYKELLANKPKLVAITAQSNVLGVRPSIQKMTELAHEAGSLVLIDAAQSIAHMPTDIQEIDCDFLVFSSHKLYGPQGVGVLYGKRKQLEVMQPVLGGGMMIHEVTKEGFSTTDIPYKFEAGTQNVSGAIGLAHAIKWLQTFDWHDIQHHEEELLLRAHASLSQMNNVTLLSSAQPSAIHGCISFIVKDIHAHDVTHMLGQKHICLRAGHHCAQPLHDTLGITASVRLSLGIYNTAEEIDACCKAIEALHL